MMKSNLAFLIPFLCGLFFTACKNNTAATAEETPEAPTLEAATLFSSDLTDEDYNAPQVVYDASALAESDFSKKLEELVYYEKPDTPEGEPDQEGHFMEYTKLYPLGWSKDGNFAWATYSVGYESGQEMTYTIQNMNTGETIWSKQMAYGVMEEGGAGEGDESAEGHFVIRKKGGESTEQLVKYLWMAREAAVLDALKKAGIEPAPSGQFMKQANYKDVSFEVEEVVKEEDEQNPHHYFLNSNKYSPKELYKDYFPVSKMKVAGVIKSPYSETIAVVCMQSRQSFEMSYVTVPFLAGYKLD